MATRRFSLLSKAVTINGRRNMIQKRPNKQQGSDEESDELSADDHSDDESHAPNETGTQQIKPIEKRKKKSSVFRGYSEQYGEILSFEEGK